MQLFGNRLHNTHRRGTLSPLAIVLIVVGAALLLTIIIGLLLNVWLDDEAYDRLTKGEPEEEEKVEINKTYTRDIHADAYVFGKEAESVWESFAEISITLNTPTGQINYTSEVVSYLAMESISQNVLYDAMGEVHLFADFAGGVFYPQALYQEGQTCNTRLPPRSAPCSRSFCTQAAARSFCAAFPLHKPIRHLFCDTSSKLRQWQESLP